MSKKGYTQHLMEMASLRCSLGSYLLNHMAESFENFGRLFVLHASPFDKFSGKSDIQSIERFRKKLQKRSKSGWW